jgi:hypothetical protein
MGRRDYMAQHRRQQDLNSAWLKAVFATPELRKFAAGE